VFWEISLNVILILIPWEKNPFLVTVFSYIDVLSFYHTDPTFADQVYDVIFDSPVAISKPFVVFNTTTPMLKKVLHQRISVVDRVSLF
jgi:hypothetical protein